MTKQSKSAKKLSDMMEIIQYYQFREEIKEVFQVDTHLEAS